MKGQKSLNSLAPGFLAMGIIVDCFHERDIECVFLKEQLEKSCEKRTELLRTNFHNTALETYY